MKGHFYKPRCKCTGKKCTCGATWTYVIDIGMDPKTGKRKQKKKGGFRTKAEAQEAAAIALAEVSQGTYVEEKNITFEEFVKIWLEIYSQNVKPNSIKNRKIHLRNLITYLKHSKMKNITRNIYQNMLNSLYNEGYSKNTLLGLHATGKLIFSKAIELGIIKNNPTNYVSIPKLKETVHDIENRNDLPRYMEKEELKTFLDCCKLYGKFGDYTLFTILSYTGIRIGEACALKWSDISFNEQVISISKTLCSESSLPIDYELFQEKRRLSYLLVTPKTKKSRRVIEVSENIINILKEHKTIQSKLKMKYRDTYIDNNFIFVLDTPVNAGKPIYNTSVQRRLRRLLEIAGMPKYTIHSFRHTHTSLLAESGVNLETIMERLGHANDTITRTIYLHVTKSQKREAAEKFYKLMQNT